MASQARNSENEIPIQRKIAGPWIGSKSGHLSPDVQDHALHIPSAVLQRSSNVVELRVLEMNRRLQALSRCHEQAPWAMFVEETFEPGAILHFAITLENGVNRFRVGRAGIARLFMTFLDCNVVEPQIQMGPIKLLGSPAGPAYTCTDSNFAQLRTVHLLAASSTAPISTIHPRGAPVNMDFAAVVRMDCRIATEVNMHTMRFKSLSFQIRSHQEYFPRGYLTDRGIAGAQAILTRGGLPNGVINYLRTCHSIQPMQELIQRQKQTNMPPSECLRAVASERVQQANGLSQRAQNARPSPPAMENSAGGDRNPESEFQKPVPKNRRRRKQPENPTGAAAPPKRANRKANQQPPAYEANHGMDAASSPMNGAMRFDQKHNLEGEDQGMMMVGSPVIMGTSLKLEEERFICKMENGSLFQSDGTTAAFSPQGCSPSPNF